MNRNLPRFLTLTLGAALLPASAAAQSANDPSASPAQTQAAVPDSVRWTLDEAIRLAVAHSPAYRQAVNDEGPAAWEVRSAYASLIPSFGLNGALGYRGPGTQTFLTTAFRQSSATVSSSYEAGLDWSLSAEKLTRPGLARARQDAVDARILSAQRALVSEVTQQYLAVLQAQASVDVQRTQVSRVEENRRLARARFEVGQVTRLDVRQAEVALGQAQVEQLRLEHLVRVELLRLFRTIGVEPPQDVRSVRLADVFEVRAPEWSLDDLLAWAERGHPGLVALRKQEDATRWEVRAARARYLPSVFVSAGWSGFTQQFTDLEPLIDGTIADEQTAADAAIADCELQNEVFARLTQPLPPQDCSSLAFTGADADALAGQIRARNEVFPFDFTQQPFQAQVVVSLPVFTGLQRTVAVSQAEAAREDARWAARDRALALQAELTERFYDVGRAHETIGIQAQNRVGARDQLALATSRYRLGQGSFFELLEAQVIAQQAERDYVNAVYEYHRAVALLEDAAGRPLR
jgi:outer membrane protein